MNLGRVEVFLILVILLGGGWLGSRYLFSGESAAACGPIALSPEVKAYIDSRLATMPPTAADIDKAQGRITDLEKRIGGLDQFRQMRQQIEEQRQQVEQLLTKRHQDERSLLDGIRVAELSRLRREAMTMCAGVTVKSGSGSGGDVLNEVLGGGSGQTGSPSQGKPTDGETTNAPGQ